LASQVYRQIVKELWEIHCTHHEDRGRDPGRSRFDVGNGILLAPGRVAAGSHTGVLAVEAVISGVRGQGSGGGTHLHARGVLPVPSGAVALGATGDTLWPFFPPMPPLKQAVPGLVYYAWSGLFLPKNVPDPIVRKLNETVTATLADPDTVQKLEKFGVEIWSSTPEEFVEQIKSDLDRFRKVLWRDRSLLSKAADWVSNGHRGEYMPEVWAPAIVFYQDFSSKNPDLGAGWFNLGYALHYSKRFDEAENAFLKARDRGFRPATTTYNIACGLSMRDRVDEAIAALRKAVALGFESGFEHDSDLENLRGDEGFRTLALKQEMRHKRG